MSFSELSLPLLSAAENLDGSQQFVDCRPDLVHFSDSDPSILEKDLLDSFNVNVIGVVKTINTFMPLIKQSSIKNVITISTGAADVDLVNKFEIDNGASYAISKSGTNMMVAKYNALYKKDGILFLAISPGVVDTGGNMREFKLMPLWPKGEA